MVGVCGGGPGGIFRLIELVDEFGGAIAADLHEYGVRFHDIGTEAFSWFDLLAYTQTLRPETHLARAINGVTYYGYTDRILGLILDSVRIGNWLDSKPGSKRPKPVKWPWIASDESEKTYGAAAPVTDIRDFLLYRNGRAPATTD